MDAVEKEFLLLWLVFTTFLCYLWLYFINDIFFIWTHGEEEFVLFLNYFLFLNSFHSNLSFTYENSKINIVFLDLSVSLRDGEIYTSFYIKVTDGQQYLHYQLSRSQHTKVLIPCSQLLRVSRGFFCQKMTLKPVFLESKGGFSEKIIQ